MKTIYTTSLSTFISKMFYISPVSYCNPGQPLKQIQRVGPLNENNIWALATYLEISDASQTYSFQAG